MDTLEVQVLGPLRVERDGAAVDLGGPKQRAVLAVLALRAGRPVRTPELVAAVWGDAANGEGKRAVQTYVSRLRALIGADRIVTHPQGYELRIEAQELDLSRLRQTLAATRETDAPAAREALRAVVPPIDTGVVADIADALDDTGLLRAVEEELLDAYEELARTELRAGAPLDAVRLLEGIVTAEPLRESAWLSLLEALRQAGRQAEALARFERLRRTLLEELGAEPSPALQRLHAQLLDGDGPVTTEPRPRSDARNPFKGLHAFGEDDAEDFFGRDRLVGQTLELLAERSIVTLVGPSGSGKSSALAAGVVPAVRRDGIGGDRGWAVTALVAAPGLTDAIHHAVATAGDRPLLVVLDHLEELFSPEYDDATVDAELAGLQTAVARAGIRIVAALRADRYDEPLRRAAFAPTFLAGLVNVVPLTPDELSEAITEPLRATGVEIEPRLLATLLADLARHPDGLPHLQHTLSELFLGREDDTLRLRDYRAIGGIEGALSRRAEEVHDRLLAGQRETLRRLALGMVVATPHGAERRRAPLADLTDAGPEADVALVVERLARWRLVVRDREPSTGEPTVTFTHDTVLRSWERLGRWIDEGRDDLRRRAGLEASATLWQESGRPDELLLVGDALAAHLAWADAAAVPLPATVRELLAASQARDEVRRADDARRDGELRRDRRRRGAVGGLVVAAVVATTAVVLWPAPPPTAVMVVDDEGALSRLYLRGAESAERELGVDVHALVRSDTDPATKMARLQRLCDDELLGVALSSHEELIDEAATLRDCGVADVVAFDTNPDWYAGFAPADDFLVRTSFVHLDVAEGAFLAGLAAATATETGVVGVVEGMPIGSVTDFTVGFVGGVAAAENGSEVVVLPVVPAPWNLGPDGRAKAFAGAFSTPANVERAVRVLVEEHGADVVLVLAGEAGAGALDAVVSYPGVWIVGADRDWQAHPSAGAPRVLGSVLKATDVAAVAAVDLLHSAPARPAVLRLGLAEGATDYLDQRSRSEASAASREAWATRIRDEGLPEPTWDHVTALDPLIPASDL